MCVNKLRFKCVVKKINTTGNPEWFHYEKHWKLQQETEEGWSDVPDLFVLIDENGDEQEISASDYKRMIERK